jgi:hypothetical protein
LSAFCHFELEKEILGIGVSAKLSRQPHKPSSLYGIGKSMRYDTDVMAPIAIVSRHGFWPTPGFESSASFP